MKALILNRDLFFSIQADYTCEPYTLHTYANVASFSAQQTLLWFVLRKAVASADMITLNLARWIITLHWNN